VWVPGYHCSAVYVRNVNVTNTRVVNVTQVTNVYNNYNRNVNVTNNYTYAHNVTAVTAVNRNTFINGGAVGHASMHVTADQIEHPQVVNHAQLQPTQRSFVGTAGTARATPPASLANRPVVTKLAPSPRAVPIGHTQPLATSQNGQFNRPAGQGQFHSFQPPAHGNANAGANARVNGNANRPAHPSGNFHAPPHPSSGTQGPRPAVQRANGGNTGSQSHAQNQHHQQPRPENNKGEGKKPEKGQ